LLVDPQADFAQHVVDLVRGGANLHFGVHQACGAYHLLHHLAAMLLLVLGRCGRHKNTLSHTLLKLFKLERSVVQSARQPKAIFHQRSFAGPVTVVHATELANHHVALVQKHNGVFGQIVCQGAGRLARSRSAQVTAIVFNAFAVPHLGQHLKVKTGSLLQALRFHQFAHAHQFFQAIGELDLDALHRVEDLFARRHIVAAGVHGKTRNALLDAARERVKQLQRFHLVVKQLNANGQFRMFGWKHIDGVAPHPKLAARKVLIVTLVLHAHQLRNHIALAHLVTHTQGHDHLVVALGFSNTVNGRHGGHNHHITAL